MKYKLLKETLGIPIGTIFIGFNENSGMLHRLVSDEVNEDGTRNEIEVQLNDRTLFEPIDTAILKNTLGEKVNFEDGVVIYSKALGIYIAVQGKETAQELIDSGEYEIGNLYK